ncbi:MAG TPA: HAMP domain-containing sensor histidine kinase [Candidatus Sulfotelmatobacter sp.]|nr:HAMP domain-containing sensor histidine kinase [Candidatus Sulfotelmatobacter sp.]
MTNLSPRCIKLEPVRDGTSIKRPFFWQAVFILLPVALLSVVSLVSLRRDAQLAEQDARNRAVDDVQSLADAMRASVNDEFQRFIALENVWMEGVREAGQPTITGVFFDDKLKSDIAKWERDYPGLTFADLATSQGGILADGRQIDPPQMSPVPTPPKWFCELSPRQQELWERLRHANESAVSIRKAYGAFYDSHPSSDALGAAIWLQQPATNAIGDSGAFPTETGLSFQEIACYRLLSAKDAKLTDSLVQSVWWQVIDHPSFVSPRLLELTEGLTNRADTALSQRVYRTRQYWNEQSKMRAWMEQLGQLPALTNWGMGTSWAIWANGPDAGALALFEPCTFAEHGYDPDPETRSLTGHGYEIWFFPREVVQAIFTRALQENKVFIPGYEAADVTVEGQPVASFQQSRDREGAEGATNQASLTSGWQLLGAASQKAGALGMTDAVHFGVNLYLTSRAQMLSSERRRFRLFAMLILAALFSALVGLVAAWRAFYRQQRLNEMKINFVSSVSHELRAPIASVRLMAENLERGKIPETPRQNEYFRFIVQECRRLSSLIENVLDFSRIEQGRKQYEFEPTNLVALVQTTVQLLEPYAAEKGVRLEIAGAGVANIELEADGRAIQQALVNLIDNAIKHSPKGEIVTMGIEWRKGDAINASAPVAVLLFVTDHGPGIPTEEHEKIFERFYRRGSELRRETQGVGIGLSVVQHIVEAHGGRVRVESAPGQGSRFTIELPLRKHE